MIIDKLSKFISKNKKETTYCPNGNLTVGAEIELQIIDNNTLNLVPLSHEIIKKCSPKYHKKIKQEIFLNMVEINSEKCTNVNDIYNDLSSSIDYLQNITKDMNISFASTGTHPFSNYNEALTTQNQRYEESIEVNQWLAKRNNIFGLHVHIGINDQEKIIKFNNFFLNFIPHLIALSASSPFWCSNDTGLKSMRPTTYESHPACGNPYNFNNWNEFEKLYNALIKSKSIKSTKDLLWDIRPSPSYGTLEIRVCDCPAKLSETAAITAFIHMLANWLDDNSNWLEKIPSPTRWVARQNKFRAIRYGLDCNIIVNESGKTKPIKEDILNWLDKIKPYSDKMSYDKHIDIIKNLCQSGNSSNRQLAIFKKSHSLKEVVLNNIKEFNEK